MIQIKEALSYDDVLLVPKHSKISSRSPECVNLSTKISKLNLELKHPLIPANMKSVVGRTLAAEALRSEGMVLLHRFKSFEDQLKDFNKLSEKHLKTAIGFSVGVKQEDYDNVKKISEIDAKIICVDVAHGDSELCHKMCKFISKNYPHIFLIAGNVVTKNAAINLWMNGVDAVKVGIGSSGICTTRIVTGNGVPSMTALSDVYDGKNQANDYFKEWEGKTKELFIIADGGIKSSGECVKSLCFADLVMIGNLFARTEESPGKIIEIDGKKYKEYNGSSTHKSTNVEGVKAFVPIDGKFSEVLDRLLQGIRSGLTYQGVSNLKDLKIAPEFVKITNAGLKESNVHDVVLKD